DAVALNREGVAVLDGTIFIGADGLFVQGFIEIPQSVGWYFSGPDLDFEGNVSATGKTYAEMIAAYQETYGEAPTAPSHAHTYDATVLLRTGLRAVGGVR